MVKIVVQSLIAGLLVCILLSCATYEKTREKHVIKIGDKKVKLKQIQSGQGGICFFNMHEDENTSVKTTKKFLKKQEGIIFYLKHGGSRNIRFDLNGKKHAFDPNRIFTDEGIKRTMMHFGDYSAEGHQAVSVFANEMLRLVDVSNQRIMIAIHNNSENEYSSSSYLPGRRYEIDAAKVNQNPKLDHDDFYFVTDSIWYEMLAEFEQNVILQDTKQGTDDGSLSIYCGRAKIPYVNVEAQHGHMKQQRQMLEVLWQVTDSLLFKTP